jgi:hypothetical protein
MFNLFSVYILERLQGRKLPAILGELSGTTERTWRNRLKDGWSPKPEELETLNERTAALTAQQMNAKGGWSEEEAQEIIARSPSRQAGVGLPTADLIYWYSPNHGEDYAESIAIARQFDLYCHALFDAWKVSEVDGARQVLLESSAWLRTFCPAGIDMSDADELEQRFHNATDLETLLDDAKHLADQLIFHVLSCWDVEFCARYFVGLVEPYPLFELVMPRLAPSIEVEQGTGRFLRDGQPPRQKVFEKSISRLVDFLAVLISWSKYRRFPDSVPLIRDMAAWFKEDEARIVSWRDETTRFTASNLAHIWMAATGPDQQGNYPGIPSPMFVAAQLWSPMLVHEDGKLTHWFICFDNYELWWTRNLNRLTAKGLKFGDIPWPKCLTDQPVGNRSPESWRSTQSSGRSSHPLDSQ